MGFRTLYYRMNVLASFSADAPVFKQVAKSELVETEVMCFDTGQFLPLHTVDSDTIYIFWDGRADFVLGEEKFEASTGYIVSVPRGVQRGFKARSKVICFALHSPPFDEQIKKDISTKMKDIEYANF